jgi:hypothetical protein
MFKYLSPLLSFLYDKNFQNTCFKLFEMHSTLLLYMITLPCNSTRTHLSDWLSSHGSNFLILPSSLASPTSGNHHSTQLLWSHSTFLFFISFLLLGFFLMLGIQLRVSYMLGKFPTTELHPQPRMTFFLDSK